MGYFMHELWTDRYWFVRPQCEFIYDGRNECLVDYVGRFEVLSEAMDYVGKQVGLDDVSLPKVNKSTSEFHPFDHSLGSLFRYKLVKLVKRRGTLLDDHRSYYDDESILRVAELYRRDIDLFGYEFDPRSPMQSGETSLLR